MKEAIVSPDASVVIQDSPVPQPGPDQVLIKVSVSGSNPKDWKSPFWQKISLNSGDDIAGTVESVGSQVTGFSKGDRVFAFHVMGDKHGSFAEYAIAPWSTTGHTPAGTTDEEAATIPLAALTAAVGLFLRLGLPSTVTAGDNGKPDKRGYNAYGVPFEEDAEKKPTPLVIYGAATAVGAFAIQLAKRAGLGPIYAIAGRGIPFVQGLIDTASGDKIIDYRKGDEAVVSALKDAQAGGLDILHAFDAVSEHGSSRNLTQALKPGSHITRVLPGPEYEAIPGTYVKSFTWVGDVHYSYSDSGLAWTQLLSKGLREGWFKPHPATVIPGGLAGIEQGLRNLKDGKASAEKYVFRISETPGLGA